VCVVEPGHNVRVGSIGWCAGCKPIHNVRLLHERIRGVRQQRHKVGGAGGVVANCVAEQGAILTMLAALIS